MWVKGGFGPAAERYYAELDGPKRANSCSPRRPLIFAAVIDFGKSIAVAVLGPPD